MVQKSKSTDVIDSDVSSVELVVCYRRMNVALASGFFTPWFFLSKMVDGEEGKKIERMQPRRDHASITRS